MENDILWYKDIIYLIPPSKFKMLVLKETHGSLATGYVGFFKTYYNAFQSCYWKGMSKKIKKFVVGCDIC